MPWYPAVGAATQPLNPDMAFERLGFSADGSMTSVINSGGANVKSSYSTIGTTTNAWCGFRLYILGDNANRALIDISIDNGTSVAIPDIPVFGPLYGYMLEFPLAVPSGRVIKIRQQCSSTTRNFPMAVRGILADPSLAPGFASAEAIIAADTTNTRPSTVDVAFSSSGPTWTQLNAATSREYGAVHMAFQSNGTTPATGNDIVPVVALGAAAAEAEYDRINGYAAANSALIALTHGLTRKKIPSGSRVAGGCLATTPGSDAGRFGLIGFY